MHRSFTHWLYWQSKEPDIMCLVSKLYALSVTYHAQCQELACCHRSTSRKPRALKWKWCTTSNRRCRLFPHYTKGCPFQGASNYLALRCSSNYLALGMATGDVQIWVGLALIGCRWGTHHGETYIHLQVYMPYDVQVQICACGLDL